MKDLKALTLIILILGFIPSCLDLDATITPDDHTPEPGGTSVDVPSETPEPEGTEPPTLTEEPTATDQPVPTWTPLPEDGIITGDPLLPVETYRLTVEELRDPSLDQSVPGYEHRSGGPQVWYRANNYYCRESDPDSTAESTCQPPWSAGDPTVALWRPEYTADRCPPHDPDGGVCEPNYHLFCYDAPCIAGWQWRIEFDQFHTVPVTGERQCELSWDAYIWSPDPVFSGRSGDWYLSGALTPDATFDDKRSVSMMAVFADNWILRAEEWEREVRFGYPENPVSGESETVPVMPFDQWRSYAVTVTVPETVIRTELVAGIGFDALWGWQNNAYVKHVSLICDGVYSDRSEPIEPEPSPERGELPPMVTPLGENFQEDGGEPISPDTPPEDASPLIVPFSLTLDAEVLTLGGGDSTMEEINILNLLVSLVFVLLGFVPALGGTAGTAVSFLVNVVKAVAVLFGKTMPDNWGGRMVVLFNFLVFCGLFLVLGQVPAETLPGPVENWFEVAITGLTFALMFLAQLKASGFTHETMVKFAPTLFSVTRRRELLSGESEDRRRTLTARIGASAN